MFSNPDQIEEREVVGFAVLCALPWLQIENRVLQQFLRRPLCSLSSATCTRAHQHVLPK